MLSRLFRKGEWRNSVVKWSCAGLLLTTGCTPNYNWRERVVADGYVQAVFPAKVQSETRTIRLGGETLSFTLAMAQVDQGVFAVGSAPLPEAMTRHGAGREAVVQALMRSLYVNIGAPVPSPLPAVGEDIVARGRVGQRPAWLRARVWMTEKMVIEAVATGPEDSLPAEQAETFMRAVKIKSLH